MRQVCNTSFVVQAQSFMDDDELDRWIRGLDREPGEPEVARRRPTQEGDMFGIPAAGVIPDRPPPAIPPHVQRVLERKANE